MNTKCFYFTENPRPSVQNCQSSFRTTYLVEMDILDFSHQAKFHDSEVRKLENPTVSLNIFKKSLFNLIVCRLKTVTYLWLHQFKFSFFTY